MMTLPHIASVAAGIAGCFAFLAWLPLGEVRMVDRTERRIAGVVRRLSPWRKIARPDRLRGYGGVTSRRRCAGFG